jgi:hypothetical protein
VRRVGNRKDALRRLRDATVACLLPGGLRIAPILKQVDLLPHEAVFLYWLARMGPGSGGIVEIVSFRGRSTDAPWLPPFHGKAILDGYLRVVRGLRAPKASG